MIGRLFLVSLMGVLASQPALATPQSCLSPAEIIGAARAENPGLDINRALIAEADTEVMDAKSRYRPRLSAFTSSSAGDAGLTERQIENQVGLRLSQRVFDFGNGGRTRRAAEFGLESQELRLLAAEDESAETALIAGLGLLNLDEELALLQARVHYFEEFAERQRSLLTEGATTRDALAAVEARLEDSRAAVSENRLRRVEAEFAYRRIVGDAPLPCSHLSDAQWIVEVGLPSTQHQSVADLLEAHPGLRGLRAEVFRGREERARERRARLPAIDVVAISAYAYNNFNEEWEYRDRVGVDISVPLYTGRGLSAQARRADARLERRQAELAQVERQIEFQIRAARQRIETGQQLVERRRVAAMSKADEMEASSLAFGIGQRTLSELLETRIGLFEANAALLEARYALLRDHVELATLAASYPRN